MAGLECCQQRAAVELGVAHILIADDSAGHLTLIDMILSANGHEVTRAGDGKEALALLRDTTPDLLILDVDMPYLDGLEIMSRARRVKRLALVPIILLTAQDPEVVRRHESAADVDLILSKPLSGKGFGELVEELLAETPGM